MIKATIITIGDEILIGQIVDTNSVSIAKHLNRAGITVAEKLSIGDDALQIEKALKTGDTKAFAAVMKAAGYDEQTINHKGITPLVVSQDEMEDLKRWSDKGNE